MKKIVLLAATVFAAPSFSQTQKRPDFFAEALQLQASATSTLISLKDSSYLHSAWDQATNSWSYIHRNVYHYNSFYKEDGDLSSNLAGSGWIPEEHAKNYVYDSNHRLLEVTFEGWSGSWNDQYKDRYTYDAAGNMLTKTEQVWVSGAWKNSYLSTYTYSGTNRTAALFQYWDNTGNSWTNNARTTFAYTGNQLTSSTDEDWNATSWTNAMRRTNFVYAGTDLLSYDFEMWNSNMGVFELKTKTSFSYDINHHVLTSFLETYNAPTTVWEKYLKTDYSYDALWNQTEIMEQIWDAGTGNWVNNSKLINYYKTGYVGANELSNNEHLNFYPNPATSLLTVSASADQQAEVITAEGKTVMTTTVSKGTNTLDLGMLSKGIYFIRIDGKTGKLILE